MSALALLARLWDRPVDPSDELRRAIAYLDWAASAEDVVGAGYGLGIVGGLLGTVLVLVAPAGYRLAAALGVVSVSLLGVHAVHTAPRLLARAHRTRSLGGAPDVVVLAVLGMRLSPSPERAAAFSARHGTGRLAASLRVHARRAKSAAGSGFGTFGAEWAEWFPALRRSLSLVDAAGNVSRAARERMLQRSLTVVLEGTRTTMQDFATRIQGPTTALYAFGVLLPTALVALLPAARAAGLPVTTPTLFLLYGVALPGVLLAASTWLLATRPVAFPPPNVSPDHPDVPDCRRQSLAAGIGGGLGAAVMAAVALPQWALPIAAVGVGLGLGCWVRFRPVLSIYDRIAAVEVGLSDALTLIGRRVANGTAVEAAVAETAEELDGEMGDVLAGTARRQRQLKVGLREAFLGTHGSLADLPSPRVHGSVAVLALAETEGAPAGEAMITLGEHVEDLAAVEREARHSLDEVCGTLRSTGTLFAPMVAGATVALADGMVADGSLIPGAGEPLPWLGLVVGWYVLVLAALLPTLATGLTRGLDRSLVCHRIGRSLPVATVVYLVAFRLTGAIA